MNTAETTRQYSTDIEKNKNKHEKLFIRAAKEVLDIQILDGILIPKEINQVTPTLPVPGGITIKFNNIKLNVKTSDSDFN